MKSLRNDVHNLSDNVHVPIKIYQKIYNGIVYITNKRHHNRIIFIFGWIEQRLNPDYSMTSVSGLSRKSEA